MSDTISDALARLSSALDRLDAASLRFADGDRARANLETELTLMRDDRRQLAAMLDAERGQRAEVEALVTGIEPRIEAAMQAIRAELAGGG